MLFLAPAAQGLFSEPDWVSLGLVSSIVGCFLIANSILFEHPRRLVENYFSRSSSRLRSSCPCMSAFSMRLSSSS